MSIALIETQKEKNARQSEWCPACESKKDIGMLVCWNCFKYRKDGKSFKYFDGDLEEWLIHIGQG